MDRLPINNSTAVFIVKFGCCSLSGNRNMCLGRPSLQLHVKAMSVMSPLLDYKACSKKDRTFAINTLFYNILSTVPFKVVPSTGDTRFPTFLPLLECFLERTFCDGAQFSYRIFLNLRLFKKRPNFLSSSAVGRVHELFSGCSSTTNIHRETAQMAVCFQNLPLGALSSRSAPSVLVGELLKKFCLFFNTGVFRKLQDLQADGILH